MRILLSILKWVGLLLLLAVVLVAGLPQLPVLKDGFGAGKYKDWLEAEMTLLDLGEADGGIKLPASVGDARLIMLSEIHGFRAVQRLDLALLRYLNENHGVRTYLAEMSPAEAMAVNEYLSGGPDGDLRQVFDRWADASAQWGNREFFDKLTAIRQLNEGLPPARKVWFVGVDQIGDREWADRVASRVWGDGAAGFGSYVGVQNINFNLYLLGVSMGDESTRYEVIEASIARILDGSGLEGETFGGAADEETFYGLWGLFHGSKVTVNGSKPLAMRLNEEGGAFEGRVVTIGTVCVDGCFNMLPAAAAPAPFQPKNGEPYVLMPMNYDDTYLARLRGIGDVKDVMGDARVAMFPVSAEGSPYLEGPRLTKATGYLMALQGFDYGGAVGEAMDHVIVMRGSAGLTPWRGEAYDVTGGNAAKAGIE